MNDENGKDPWETEMSREFDQRVRDLHEAPLSFENVRGKAMTIRRNRRIAVAGGILAAAAVVVPVGIIAGNGFGNADDARPDFASNSPTPTQATDPNAPTRGPEPGTLAVPYLAGSTWHRVDGSTVKLFDTYTAGVQLGDQLIATSNTDGGLSIDVVEPDGTVADSFAALSYPVANADHTTVAYIAPDGSLQTRWADGEVSMGGGFTDGDSVAAVTGGPNCFEEVDGCVVYVNHGDGSTPEALDSHGIQDVVAQEPIKVNDVSSDGRVAAQTESTIEGSCSAVYDQQAGAEVFETCTFSFDEFSPDGGYLSGADAYRDGFGQGYVVILDAATGEEVARWQETSAATAWVWEDESHLLIQAYDGTTWSIHRLGVDGTSEQVLASSEGDDATPAFTLLGGY